MSELLVFRALWREFQYEFKKKNNHFQAKAATFGEAARKLDARNVRNARNVRRTNIFEVIISFYQHSLKKWPKLFISYDVRFHCFFIDKLPIDEVLF